MNKQLLFLIVSLLTITSTAFCKTNLNGCTNGRCGIQRPKVVKYKNGCANGSCGQRPTYKQTSCMNGQCGRSAR